jgi:ankyrin repeat protein
MKYYCAFFAGLLLSASPAIAGPLHDAVTQGDVTQATQLLDGGADPTEPDATGEPPLLIAALKGNASIVALLVDRGADINVRNKRGLTALHAAAYGGNLQVVRLLLSKGASVNDSDNFFKMSPLHAAAEEGHADVVKVLLDAKADIEAQERNGYTPLTQAGWREHWDAADLLMKAGAACQKADLVGDWLYKECSKRQ